MIRDAHFVHELCGRAYAWEYRERHLLICPEPNPIEDEPERFLCATPSCPVATSHPSGLCAYCGKRGAFA